MTDLDHTYTSDIAFQETQVDSADSQFTIQRMGQNNNYLFDYQASIAAALASLSSTVGRLETFNADGTYGVGNHIIFSPGHLLKFAIIWVVPLLNNVIANTGGPGGQTYGPAIPIVVEQAPNGNSNFNYFISNSSTAKLDIVSNPTYQQIQLAIGLTPATLQINGLVFR